MTQLAVAAIAISVLGWLLSRVSLRRRHAITWWQLRPVTPEADPTAAALAVSSLRRGRRSGTVTIVREGGEAETARQWIGVEGSSDIERSALAIARSAGCVLGDQEAPPAGPTSGLQWWYSTPMVPMGSEVFAESGIDEPGFADHANAMLEPEDLLIISARPNRRTSSTVSAAAMTTAEPMSSAWFDNPPPSPRRPPPHIAIVLPLLAFLMSVVPVVVGALIRPQPPQVFVLTAIGAAAAVWSGLACVKSAPAARSVSSGGGVNIPAESGRLIDRLFRRSKTPEDGGGGWSPAPIPARLVAAWASGGHRTTVAAQVRYAAEVLTDPDGALLGVDLAGRECWLPDHDRQWGVFVLGDPGTGKTTLLLGLLAADCRAVAESGVRRAQIWIETKGEGRGRAEKVMRDNGRQPLVIQADDPTGPRLDLIDWSDPTRSAKTMSEAMRYAFPDQAIMEESAEVLSTVFRAAIAAPPEGLSELGYPARPNLPELCYWMLGGDPVSKKKEQIERVLGKTPEYAQVLRYTQHKNSFQQERRLESSINKLQSLRAASGLWSTGVRREAVLSKLIEEHHAVVLNFGPSGPSGAYSEMTASRAAAMSMFFLWDTIKRICDGWQAQGRSIAIYSDELADIAGHGDPSLEVVRAMADQGRSRGVLAAFAAQRPGQIPERTREAVMSFGSRAYFRVDEVETATNACSDLDDAYHVEEIRNMEQFRCAARVRRSGIAQPAFTLLPQHL